MALKPFWNKKYHLGMTGDEVKKVLEKVEKDTNVITSDDYNAVLTINDINTLVVTGRLENVAVNNYNAEKIPDYIWVFMTGFGVYKIRLSSVTENHINYTGVYYIESAANSYQIIASVSKVVNTALVSAIPVG